mmetsp:Transcript_7040/g.9772  ORF Transcript_7040/g.9772 Transcript_7040/m.9772 type:complete len:205 (+) Transcript_7040:1442-2056(+)
MPTVEARAIEETTSGSTARGAICSVFLFPNGTTDAENDGRTRCCWIFVASKLPGVIDPIFILSVCENREGLLFVEDAAGERETTFAWPERAARSVNALKRNAGMMKRRDEDLTAIGRRLVAPKAILADFFLSFVFGKCVGMCVSQQFSSPLKLFQFCCLCPSLRLKDRMLRSRPSRKLKRERKRERERERDCVRSCVAEVRGLW